MTRIAKIEGAKHTQWIIRSNCFCFITTIYYARKNTRVRRMPTTRRQERRDRGGVEELLNVSMWCSCYMTTWYMCRPLVETWKKKKKRKTNKKKKRKNLSFEYFYEYGVPRVSTLHNIMPKRKSFKQHIIFATPTVLCICVCVDNILFICMIHWQFLPPDL